MSTTTHLITADELERDYHGVRCELVKGEIVQMAPAGAEHGDIAGHFFALIFAVVKAHKLGRVFAAETGFYLERNPDSVRAPDVAFVENSKIYTWPIESFFEGAPTLAVEVLSPSDTAEYADEKVGEYFDAGTREVWVASPRFKTVKVYRDDQPVRTLRKDDVLTTPLLPGFAHPISTFFT